MVGICQRCHTTAALTEVINTQKPREQPLRLCAVCVREVVRPATVSQVKKKQQKQ
jgi:NAD-dependent SIR2 family protein deacetylase